MDETIVTTRPLKPALASIPDACKYLGGLSRAALYKDYLPRLDTVHLGARHFVIVASMDRLIEYLAAARNRSASISDDRQTLNESSRDAKGARREGGSP